MSIEIKNAWDKYNEDGIKKIFDFCEGYRNYISDCKTERECIKEAIKLAEEKGYRNLDEVIRFEDVKQRGD